MDAVDVLRSTHYLFDIHSTFNQGVSINNQIDSHKISIQFALLAAIKTYLVKVWKTVVLAEHKDVPFYHLTTDLISMEISGKTFDN